MLEEYDVEPAASGRIYIMMGNFYVAFRLRFILYIFDLSLKELLTLDLLYYPSLVFFFFSKLEYLICV